MSENTNVQEKPKKNRLYAVVRRVGAILFHTIVPTRYQGIERLNDLKAPAILIANHASWLDPLMVAYAFRKDEIIFLGKKELTKYRLGALFLQKMRMIVVDRGGMDIAALRACSKTLREGKMLGIFPEGTRYHEGVMEHIEEGTALLALRSGAPLVPFYIAGKPRFFHMNRVYVGPCIEYADIREKGTDREACAELMARITQTYAVWQKDPAGK